MNVYERFARATRRVASLSSVARNRLDESARAERRGAEGELAVRLEPVVSRLEALADEMERALA